MTGRPVPIQELAEWVREGRLSEFLAAAAALEPADLADVLRELDDDERVTVVRMLPPEISGLALVELPEEEHAEDTLAALDPEHAADIVEQLEDDDAADLLGDLEPGDRDRILAAVEDREDREGVERLLRYDEESAGGLMTGQVVAVHDSATVGQALDEIRHQAEEVDQFAQVFVIDHRRHLVGVLSFRSIVVSPATRPVREVMEPADLMVTPETDQEEVARLMARYNVPSIPVVEHDGRLLGRITFDDVSDVVEAETTEDLLRFGGVPADEDLGAGWGEAVRSRLPWLLVNLVTAFMAASVVLFFQGAVSRLVVLAAWMPVIAGMGGNAGTQALAVTVRRLAIGQLPVHEFTRVVTKEMLVGAINGRVGGIVVWGVALLTQQPPMLGLVVFLAMAGNLVVAGFAGAFIPILLERFDVDPAIASSVFVTTLTDICGFALLLGLAGVLLL